MNAPHVTVSPTGPSDSGTDRQVTLETPINTLATVRRFARFGNTWEQFEHPAGDSDIDGVDRMNGRCFVPYVQDPPTVLVEPAEFADC